MHKIIVSTGTETFAKEPKVVKLFPEPKSTSVRCHKSPPVMLDLLHFGQHVNGCFFHRCILLLAGIDRRNIYNRLGIACTVNTTTGVRCLCFTSEKASLSSNFFGFHCFILSARHNQSANLAFRTTGIEDTHLTPVAILFQVEGNNSLNFFANTKIRQIPW